MGYFDDATLHEREARSRNAQQWCFLDTRRYTDVKRDLAAIFEPSERTVIERAAIGRYSGTREEVGDRDLVRRQGHRFQPEQIVASTQVESVVDAVVSGESQLAQKRRSIARFGGADNVTTPVLRMEFWFPLLWKTPNLAKPSTVNRPRHSSVASTPNCPPYKRFCVTVSYVDGSTAAFRAAWKCSSSSR